MSIMIYNGHKMNIKNGLYYIIILLFFSFSFHLIVNLLLFNITYPNFLFTFSLLKLSREL